MLEPVHVTGAEDKTTAQLKKISPELMIRMPGGFSASARLGIVASQQVKQVSAFELHGGIGFTLLVNQQGKGNARFLAEGACIHAITKFSVLPSKTGTGMGRAGWTGSMVKQAQVPDAGEILWIEFSLQVGRLINNGNESER